MIDDKFSYNAPFQVPVASDREKEMYNTVSNLLTSFRNLANHYDGLSLEIKNVGSIVDMVNKSGLYGLEFYFDSQVVGTLWFRRGKFFKEKCISYCKSGVVFS